MDENSTIKSLRTRHIMAIAGVLAVASIILGSAMSVDAQNERLDESGAEMRDADQRLDKIEALVDRLGVALADLVTQIEALRGGEVEPEEPPMLAEGDLYGRDCHFRIDEQTGITGSLYGSYSHGLLLSCRDAAVESWDFRTQFDNCSASVVETDGRMRTVITCWQTDGDIRSPP